MAENNGAQLAAKIEAAAKKAKKLQKDKDLIDLINELDNLKKECSGYNGEVARVCPPRLMGEISKLVTIFKSLKSTAMASEKALYELSNFVDSIPSGEFRKKFIDDTDVEDAGPDLNPGLLGDTAESGILPEQSINTTPDTSAGAQSAVLANESLGDYYRRDFNNGQAFREARESAAFSFNKISTDLDSAGFDFDFTNQNANSSFPTSASFRERVEAENGANYNNDNVFGAISSSLRESMPAANNGMPNNMAPTALNMRSIMAGLPRGAGDVAGGSMAMQESSGVMIGGGHVIDNMWNTNEQIKAPSMEDKLANIDIDMSDINIVGE